MKKQLNWIIYLADGTKRILTQSEVDKQIGKIPKGKSYKFSNKRWTIDGIDVVSAVREDCNIFYPPPKKRIKEISVLKA